ncbi:MAG: hypothetical protein AAF078_12905, partial [Planctomycetota bacterium]
MKPCRFAAPLLAALFAVPASADATDRLADLQAAYRDPSAVTYTADVEFYSVDGRWETVNTTTYAVRWDPQGPDLRLSHPSFDLSWDGAELLATSSELRGRALIAETPADAEWAELVEAFPPLGTMLPLPDLALALAADPAAVIGDADTTTVEAEADAAVRITGEQTATLTPDPTTGRLSTAVTESSPAFGVPVRVTHTFAEAEEGDAAQAVADRLAPIETDPQAMAIAATFDDWINGPARPGA